MLDCLSSLIPDELRYDSIDNPYIVTTPPATTPITLRDLKNHLRLPSVSRGEDPYLTAIIKAVTQFAEKYTGRTFITTTFKTFRDRFPNHFTLRRSLLQQVASISYFLKDILTLVDPAVYYVTESNDFSSIYNFPNTCWPLEIDFRKQAVEIIFTAGYGDSAKDVPESIKLGLLNHAAKIYTSRGDCEESRRGSASFTSAAVDRCLPCEAKMLYDQCTILNSSPFNVT